MTIRIVSRLILLLVVLAAATAVIVGGLSLLASTSTADAAPLLQRDQAAAVERAIEAPADEASDSTPTPAVVLVFAGIVLMAALPPIHRVHVYHRSYHRSDWL
jgi:formate hydrogenlyase subunit 3/multisubunit Na+/H+ antiporter MnhD subunit